MRSAILESYIQDGTVEEAWGSESLKKIKDLFKTELSTKKSYIVPDRKLQQYPLLQDSTRIFIREDFSK